VGLSKKQLSRAPRALEDPMRAARLYLRELRSQRSNAIAVPSAASIIAFTSSLAWRFRRRHTGAGPTPKRPVSSLRSSPYLNPSQNQMLDPSPTQRRPAPLALLEPYPNRSRSRLRPKPWTKGRSTGEPVTSRRGAGGSRSPEPRPSPRRRTHDACTGNTPQLRAL
jgi:hypothetical protein